MITSLFYNHITKNGTNNAAVDSIELFSKQNPNQQIYLINAPLGEKYTYDYQENVLVILAPKHKIMLVDLAGKSEQFDVYCEDFIEDLSFLSDKYKYKEHIGRARDWKKEIISITEANGEFNPAKLFKDSQLPKQLQRKSELLISLLIGSINDIEKIGVEVPETLLDRVKKNIMLFDGDQTRFIYQDFRSKQVSIQGLSGTGKTELLLHKLKELYLADDDTKIFLTCHNITLANTLRNRIPGFFNFMRVEKQIEWNSRLWVGWAWGSQKDPNSGLYSYLCHFYKVPFLRFDYYTTGYKEIFSQILSHINQIGVKEFEYAFDYILIDERQDFPKVFFELCDKIAKNKIYIAGDIFQDIYENTNETELNVDVILNRCYRTDPRTLMFAHAIGMKLFEKNKLNWFEDSYWKAIGYKFERIKDTRNVLLSRDPIRRFEDLELDEIESVVIKNTTKISSVIGILRDIQTVHSTVSPSDIAIIILDTQKTIYKYIDSICYAISETFGWEVNRAYESKSKVDNSVYITNPNNVKGLEFPFVLCITAGVEDSYRYRNILYTMLTRSFIQSYLLVENPRKLEVFDRGLRAINKFRAIVAEEPTDEEKDAIKNKLLKLQEEGNLSFKDFLEKIFVEQKINKKYYEKLENALLQTDIEKFDREKTIRFINANREFFSE
jgi:superfamily I DNA and RNA helicase